MKKEDKRNLIIFICLIFLIGITCLYDFFAYSKTDVNIDRKVKNIFGNYTYNNVLEESQKLFFNYLAIYDHSAFTYELKEDKHPKYFAIGDYNRYKKVDNLGSLINILNGNTVNNFLEEHQIIAYNNEYYIKEYDNPKINDKYVGSIINIKKYDDKYVYLESENYFCDNYHFIGLLEEKPNCLFTKTITTYKTMLSNNYLRITDYKEIENSWQ